MPARALGKIEKGIFRANPCYELVLFDRLDSEHREALADLRRDPELYGILQPRVNTGLSIKAVSRDTALLFLTLRDPDSLPAYVTAVFREECNETIARLVLDSILEIEQEGTFVSGIAARRQFYGETRSFAPSGRLSQLSIEALKYAQALKISDISKLSARMYFYNRVPVSPFWRRFFPTSTAVAQHLGLNSQRQVGRTLSQKWSEIRQPQLGDGWRRWQARSTRVSLHEPQTTYKLYLSPDPRFVREGFQAAVDVLTVVRAPTMKVGSDVYGLLRPDKIVGYFRNFEQLQDAAERLQQHLHGCPAHGVPFTAEIATDGLLSWGVDPPREQQTPGRRERESWRLWLTSRLAVTLVAAQASGSADVEPWQFALDRLRLDCIDPATWTPETRLWRPERTNGFEGPA